MVARSGEPVTPATFIRAETDRYFHDIVRQAGGINRLFHFRRLAGLQEQTIVRMNRDTLYSMGVVDTSNGARITLPRPPRPRYLSVYLVDNDHYVPDVIYEPGSHRLPDDTRYLGVGIRIQIFDPDDDAEIAEINALQDGFHIDASSADPLPEFRWDQTSLDALRAEYEAEFARVDRYPDDWQGARGTVNEGTRHLAAAGAWGLFPNAHATYINYSGADLPGDRCYAATYAVPDNDAFWSITAYGRDGYMQSERCLINASNVEMNADDTFTVRFGSADLCGDAPNRLDVTDGWNFLMRIYRPGASVLDGSYRLPEVEPAPPAGGSASTGGPTRGRNT